MNVVYLQEIHNNDIDVTIDFFSVTGFDMYPHKNIVPLDINVRFKSKSYLFVTLRIFSCAF